MCKRSQSCIRFRIAKERVELVTLVAHSVIAIVRNGVRGRNGCRKLQTVTRASLAAEKTTSRSHFCILEVGIVLEVCAGSVVVVGSDATGAVWFGSEVWKHICCVRSQFRQQIAGWTTVRWLFSGSRKAGIFATMFVN